MVEHQTFNLRVQGSSPCSGALYSVEKFTLFAVDIDSFAFKMCQVGLCFSCHLADSGISVSHCPLV